LAVVCPGRSSIKHGPDDREDHVAESGEDEDLKEVEFLMKM
jgi:hypothetical protein